MKQKKCFPVKKLKEITDEIAVSEYADFYSSVCAKNRKWLLKNIGRP